MSYRNEPGLASPPCSVTSWGQSPHKDEGRSRKAATGTISQLAFPWQQTEGCIFTATHTTSRAGTLVTAVTPAWYSFWVASTQLTSLTPSSARTVLSGWGWSAPVQDPHLSITQRISGVGPRILQFQQAPHMLVHMLEPQVFC